jgi:hypothetical protein
VQKINGINCKGGSINPLEKSKNNHHRYSHILCKVCFTKWSLTMYGQSGANNDAETTMAIGKIDNNDVPALTNNNKSIRKE